MRNLLIAILLFICMSCTTTRYIDREVPIETVRTEYINQLYKDSIFIHDSIDRYISGDTVYMYKYKYIYKYLNRVDTIVNTDTIHVPLEIKTIETKEVNKIKWYQSILMWLGGLSTILLAFKLGKFISTKIRR